MVSNTYLGSCLTHFLLLFIALHCKSIFFFGGRWHHFIFVYSKVYPGPVLMSNELHTLCCLLLFYGTAVVFTFCRIITETSHVLSPTTLLVASCRACVRIARRTKQTKNMQPRARSSNEPWCARVTYSTATSVIINTRAFRLTSCDGHYPTVPQPATSLILPTANRPGAFLFVTTRPAPKKNSHYRPPTRFWRRPRETTFVIAGRLKSPIFTTS